MFNVGAPVNTLSSVDNILLKDLKSTVNSITELYNDANGKTSEWMKIGFSPRKQYIALYLMTDYSQHDAQLQKLGKYKTSKACLYINKLADIDMDVLKELIKQSFNHAQ